MTYTQAVLVAVPAAVLLDLVVLRTRVLLTRQWWLAYAIVVVFQLLTNGWLTGRGIVRYAPEALWGPRLAWAPVEDLGFGFAMVVSVVSVWVRLTARERG